MLSAENDSGAQSLTRTTKLKLKIVGFLANITVEPLFFVSLFTIVFYSIISQQFIYQQISAKYGLANATQSSLCKTSNASNLTKELQSIVSAETSSWVLYLNIAGFVPSFFCTILIGAWGDSVGRKAPLLCGFTGLFLMILTYFIVVQFQLDIAFLIIARVVAGLTGDFNCILASCYAYLADISPRNKLTLKVAIGEACTGLGGLLASVVSGLWIDAQGFIPPLLLMLALLFATIVYIIVFLDERSSSSSRLNIKYCDKFRSLFSSSPFRVMWVFLSSDRKRTLKVLGIGLCFFLQLCVHDGTGDVVVIYELSPPLCWSSLLVGLGSAARDSAYLFGIGVIKGLSKRFSDLAFIFVSSVSSTLGLVMYGVAYETWIMFLGYSFAILRTVSATVLRSMMSRLVKRDSQGSAFAIIACVESISLLAASSIFNLVYSNTVHVFPGAVFFVGVGIQVMFFILAWFVSLKTKQDIQAIEDEVYQQHLSIDSSFTSEA